MNRRTSIYSQSQPPLPHQPQAHFYGAPDIDLGLPRAKHAQARAGDGMYYYRFDSLASAGHEGPKALDIVLLSGTYGALEVFKLEKDKMESVGRLEGLRGGVHSAKILPCTTRKDPLKPKRPLIALIIHGPVLARSTMSDERDVNSLNDPTSDDPGIPAMDATTRPSLPSGGYRSKEVTQYQTSVEVYSLKTQELISTLLCCPATAITSPETRSLVSPPLPTGNLRVEANGKYITVASGTSGEVFIFSLEAGDDTGKVFFQCIGKVWTSVKASTRRSVSASSSSTGSINQNDVETYPFLGSPLISLSHRWLAVVPPNTSSQIYLNATVLLPEFDRKVPGLETLTAPSQPEPTCVIDSPQAESLINKVAREVTQEFIKGAKWVGDQGIQAWKSYWAKPQEVNTSTDAYRARNEAIHPVSRQPPLNFPPTHAFEDAGPQASSDRALVSIVDLDQLGRGYDSKPPALTITPIATFEAPSGCSHVSFAPSGLMLLTASRKGDVQYVWDLMRMVSGKEDYSGTQDIIRNPGGGSDMQEPSVRQVARFARMTVASIIDVVWAAPRGDRLAIVTENGTAHIFELPASSFLWPPPRRSVRPVTAPQSSVSAETENETAIEDRPRSNTLSSAISMVNNRAQPLLAAVRNRPPSIGSAFSGIGGFGVTSAVGAKSGKAVAAGFSKSVEAASGTVNTLRHVGDNRLHLPGSAIARAVGSVRWMNGRDQERVAVVGGGVVRIHTIAHSTASRKGSKRQSFVVSGRPLELAVPHISDGLVAEHSRSDDGTHDSARPSFGYWTLQPSPSAGRKTVKPHAHPLSFAEIETNPPYQPFHTDPRVSLSVYDDPPAWQDVNPPSPSNREIWIFGEHIAATKVDLGSAVLDTDADADGEPGQQGRGRMENVMTVQKRDEVLVVTTRRRRGRRLEQGEEEEFFEDDCEVVDFAEDRV